MNQSNDTSMGRPLDLDFSGGNRSAGYGRRGNADSIISYATVVLVERIATCGVSPVLFLVGVPTNVLNCIVFYRQGLRDRMNLLLFSLALVDMAFVALFLVTNSHCLLGFFRPDLEGWWKVYERKYFAGLHRGFLISSGCLTTIVAVERCLCVTLPLKAASLIKTRTVAVLVVVIVVLTQAACSVYSLIIGVTSREDPKTGQISYRFTTTQFSLDHEVLVDVLVNIILKTVVPLTTFVVIAIATAITVIRLKRAISWREEPGSGGCDVNSRRQRALAKMLVIISCIYVLTSAPNVAMGLATLIVPGFSAAGQFSNIFLATRLFPGMFAMLNSSINFFVYVTRSSKYREELRAMFSCKVPKRAESTKSDASKGSKRTKVEVYSVSSG
nr:hypothetical protein BaRGS_020319 [Batillaria attramentaria]